MSGVLSVEEGRSSFGCGLGSRSKGIESVAKAVTRRVPGLWAGRDHDDVVSILHEVLWGIWRDAGERFPDDWERQLWFKGRVAVRQWADRSAGLGGVTGASEKRRQVRSVMSAEPDWQAAHGGRSPGPKELANWCAEMGVSISETDVVSVNRVMPLSSANEAAMARRADSVADDVAEWADAQAMAEAIVAMAETRGSRFGNFARMWLAGILVGDGPSVSEVARAAGVPRASANRYVAALRAYARELEANAVLSAAT